MKDNFDLIRQYFNDILDEPYSEEHNLIGTENCTINDVKWVDVHPDHLPVARIRRYNGVIPWERLTREARELVIAWSNKKLSPLNRVMTGINISEILLCNKQLIKKLREQEDGHNERSSS